MDFGKKILEKYGYREGAGLGKNSDGIVDPIKAKFKFDQKGFGGDGLKEETNHWWTRTYEEAANNINVSNGNDQIKIDLKDQDGVEITNKSYSLKKLKEANKTLQYGSFLKAATLKGHEEEIEGHVKTEDIEIKQIPVLSDEQLLKACEYRTAHKGARHGLRLSGKLERIAQQEKELLERMKQDRTKVFSAIPSKQIANLNSSKDDSDDEEKLPINLSPEAENVSKSQKKRQKKKLSVLTNQIEDWCIEKNNDEEASAALSSKKNVHDDTPVKAKSKRQKRKIIEESVREEADEQEPVTNESQKGSKKKKKAKKRALDSEDEKMLEPEKVADENETVAVASKRAKVDKSIESSEKEEDDKDEALERLNESHHQKLNCKRQLNAERGLSSLENSAKKMKKNKKSKRKTSGDDDSNWKLQNNKKLEKYEKKALKLQMKQQKIMEEKMRIGNKAKKRLKKEAKRKVEAITNEFDIVL